MKTDDDIFVNVPLLHKAIMKEEGFDKISGIALKSVGEYNNLLTSLLPGCIKNSPLNAPQPLPSANNPLPLPSLPQAHPLFTAGAGYIIPNSNKNVELLYLASLETRLLPVEDVYTTG